MGRRGANHRLRPRTGRLPEDDLDGCVGQGRITGRGCFDRAGHDADAIGVSNHGARNLDCLPGPVEELPAIAEAVVGRLDILADIARCAGGVLLDRAPLYGGAAGAGRVLDVLATQLLSQQRKPPSCGRSIGRYDGASPPLRFRHRDGREPAGSRHAPDRPRPTDRGPKSAGAASG